VNINKNILLLAETNFILDLIFEQAPESERLFVLARKHDLQLIVPEYSFAEAEGNIGTTIQKRHASLDTALVALKQSERSAYHDVIPLIQQLEHFKTRSIAEEQPNLHAKIEHLAQIASIIPFSGDIAARAELRGLRRLAPMKASDRNIYESILHFAQANRSPGTQMIFLTRDIGDFDFPYLHQELAELSVELRFSAGDCIRRIRELLEI